MKRLLSLATVGLVVASCTGVSTGAGAPPKTTVPVLPTDAQAAKGCVIPPLPYDASDASDDTGTYGGRTTPIFPPVLSGGDLVSSISGSALGASGLELPQHEPMGLPVAAIISRAGGAAGTASDPASVAVYYATGSVGPKDTLPALLARPGAMLLVTDTEGDDAKHVVETIGDRATLIDVGPYQAALTHTSAFPNGLRMFNVYWSDGTLDFALVVNGSAAEAIETAQSIYCG